MSFLTILETLLLGPLKLFFEFVFQVAYSFVNHPGFAIIFLTLAMNILVLPLYKRADAMQEEARDMDVKLHRGVAHIKKVFSGDEKMMILQTYYRQNNYKPTSALNGSVSLLLEIPFFIAAYQFLSNLEMLNGASFGPVSNLGAPDGLLAIGTITINILPVIMTGINLISCLLYLKGFPLKTKIQLYGMALFFLVFLYDSPSGLVFYWTLNNLFSLAKTIFYKIKKPSGRLSVKTSINKENSNKKIFLLGALFLTLLTGVLIPSAFISASPQEYVDITYYHNPLWYIVSSACMAAGTFLVWLRVFYWLAASKGKVLFDRIIWIMCGVLVINYMFFGTNSGIISHTLQYEKGLLFSDVEQVVNIAVIILVCAIMYLIAVKWSKVVVPVLLTAVIAFGCMSVMNIVNIKCSVEDISVTQTEEKPNIMLSKNGKNVVVLMLDRALGEYVPYIMNEKPELKEKFSGFTYYSNTISFAGHTNFAVPGMMGGYEYTPVEMNIRNEETLASKHNEALKVMPVLFAQEGYSVTVCDPPYANYKWIPDLSIYEDYPEIKTFNTAGTFVAPEQKEQMIQANHRNFFCLSIMKTMPLCMQPLIYSDGTYNQTDLKENVKYTVQITDGTSVADGISAGFMSSYNVLDNMSNITYVNDEAENTFLFMCNDVTHQPMLLQEPEYVPVNHVDNTRYDADNMWRFTVNNKTLKMTDTSQYAHYQSNMAAFIQLGKWFDYLRENGVYDNTKIIIVSDHGYPISHFEDLVLGMETDEGEEGFDSIENYYPLLMVKDFDSEGFSISDEFMTNADVPTLATKNIITSPVNPFTGKAITDSEKTAHDQFIILSNDWDVTENNGNTFLPAKWACVSSNLWDRSNWSFFEEKTVLNKHSFAE